MRELIRRLPTILQGWITPNWQTFMASKEPQLWLISILIGLAVSVAAILFRLLILNTQFLWLGVAAETVTTTAKEIHWIWIFLAPTVGGLLVGWRRRSGGDGR